MHILMLHGHVYIFRLDHIAWYMFQDDEHVAINIYLKLVEFQMWTDPLYEPVISIWRSGWEQTARTGEYTLSVLTQRPVWQSQIWRDDEATSRVNII